MTPWHLNKFHDTRRGDTSVTSDTDICYVHITEDNNNVLIWAGQIGMNSNCHQMLINDYLEYEDEENVVYSFSSWLHNA